MMTAFTSLASTLRRLAPASLVVLALNAEGGCDVELLPEAASYEGSSAPRVSLRVGGDATDMEMDVQAVDVEIVDVLVHRESDDAWVWIGGVDRVELGAVSIDTNRPVPLPADRYDALRIVVDEPRVALGGKWHKAELTNDQLELPLDLQLDADHIVELRFDLRASLSGSKADKWTFDPWADVVVVD